jgi:hypothetical protein
MINRRLFCCALLLLGTAGFVTGCSNPSPGEVTEKQKNCQHEWETAPSGDKRCTKCGRYQSK